MSQWTHVAGIIRLDGGGPVTGMSKQDEERIVNEVLSSSPLPHGSEGPVQYSFHHHGRDGENSASAYRGAILIWGDLRDYGANKEEIDEIVDWFVWLKNKFNGTRKMPFWFREGVLSIDVEFMRVKFILVDDSEKGLVKVKAKKKRG